MEKKLQYVSYKGEGVEGWKSFLEMKTRYSDHLSFMQFTGDNYATGIVLDVTEGLFADEALDVVKPFLDDNGAFPTGVCKDYVGHWMLRRSLWTEDDGTEYVAEGTVADDGQIINPIRICSHQYAENTLYPLTGTLDEVWMKTAWKVAENETPGTVHQKRGYANLVVPFSFFEYVQHVFKMYFFCERSSRTFKIVWTLMDDGNILLEHVFDKIRVVWDPWDVEYYDAYLRSVISPDGRIIEPLHIDNPVDDFLISEFEEKYADYYKKIEFMPQPWNKHCKWSDLDDWKKRNQKRFNKKRKRKK